jgi:hypothetical protein
MSGDADVTVVTTLVWFYFFATRGCGRVERPAFPAPSVFQMADVVGKLARTRGENTEVWAGDAAV